MILFSISFIGAWVPSFWPAFLVGCLSLALIVYFTLKIKSIKTPSIYFFMIYLLGNIAAAALFRSADYRAAVSFRYIIIPISILTCIVFLSEETFLSKLNRKWINTIICLFMSGSVLYSVSFLAIGGPLFAKRNETLRHNILCWPSGGAASLRCPDNEYEICNGYLLEAEKNLIYSPHCVLRNGETIPTQPRQWLK